MEQLAAARRPGRLDINRYDTQNTQFCAAPSCDPSASPTENARGGITAADHIEAARLALRVYGRSQVRSFSWQDRSGGDRAARSVTKASIS